MKPTVRPKPGTPIEPDTGHLATFDEQLAGHFLGSNGSEPSAPKTTWAPLDLGPVLAGDELEQPPAILARTDGPCLLYAGKSHGVFGESESGKTLLAERTALELIEDGREVLYIDFEDGPESAVGRLVGMGARPDAISTRFHYVRPDEPLSAGAWAELESVLDGIELAVIDGVTEGLTLHGLALLDNTDIAKWLELIVRPLQRRGAAVLQLDHVTKDREGRGRYAIGAQHKLAGIDVAYSLRVIEPFGRGVNGSVLISVEKDRPGHLRALAEGKALATMHVESLPGGALEISLEPPEAGGDLFRPTVLMGRVSRALVEQPGLTANAIKAAVTGKAAAVGLAVELLVAEGFVRIERDGQTHRHYSERRFEDTAVGPG